MNQKKKCTWCKLYQSYASFKIEKKAI